VPAGGVLCIFLLLLARLKAPRRCVAWSGRSMEAAAACISSFALWRRRCGSSGGLPVPLRTGRIFAPALA